jgi:hypothetical protein
MESSRRRRFPLERGRPRPKHALSSAGRMQRKRIRPRQSHARLSHDGWLVSFAGAVRYSRLSSTPHPLIRWLRLPRTSRANSAYSVGRYLIGAGRYRALFVIFAVCAMGAAAVLAAPDLISTSRPQMPVANRAALSSRKPGSTPRMLPQYSIRKAPPIRSERPEAPPQTDDAPRAASLPPARGFQPAPATTMPQDLVIEVQDLPPGQADPELEAALSDLDKQADLDDVTRRQLTAPGQPVVANAAPPGAQVPNAPRPGP